MFGSACFRSVRPLFFGGVSCDMLEVCLLVSFSLVTNFSCNLNLLILIFDQSFWSRLLDSMILMFIVLNPSISSLDSPMCAISYSSVFFYRGKLQKLDIVVIDSMSY